MRVRQTIAIILVFGFSIVSVRADGKADAVEQAKPGAGLTIYMNLSMLGRKSRAAKRMTELHQKYYSKGWSVVDVDPYLENGDLQGFFITYVGRK